MELRWRQEKKYYLVGWPMVCMPKGQDGLGILDLGTMNSALLGKWFWRLENEDGQWQEMLRRKYLSKNTLAHVVPKVGDSWF